jgi:hypothetical protein
MSQQHQWPVFSLCPGQPPHVSSCRHILSTLRRHHLHTAVAPILIYRAPRRETNSQNTQHHDPHAKSKKSMTTAFRPATAPRITTTCTSTSTCIRITAPQSILSHHSVQTTTLPCLPSLSPLSLPAPCSRATPLFNLTASPIWPLCADKYLRRTRLMSLRARNTLSRHAGLRQTPIRTSQTNNRDIKAQSTKVYLDVWLARGIIMRRACN